MLVADTSFLDILEKEIIAGTKGPAGQAFERFKGREKIVISVVSIGEFLRSRDRIEALQFLEKWAKEPVNQRTGEIWALMQSRLREPLGANDAWVAATAIQLGAGVLGRDTAFERVPRLRYEKI